MNETGRCPTVASEAARPLRLAFLICTHIVVCCESLFWIASYKINTPVYDPASFHIFFDPARWYIAVAWAGAFALVSSVFILTRFSFGYLVGFYLYTMVLGYLWLNPFTDLQYDHRLTALSAAASAIAFLLPALFITAPIRQIHPMTPRSFDRLLTGILILSALVIAIGATYNFRLVSLDNMYEYRAKLHNPTIVNYLVTIVSSALLPFAFAGFVTRKAYWRTAAVLVLLLLLYPIALNKITLFTPLWLVVMIVLSRLFEARIAVVLSLLVPVVVGLALIIVFGDRGAFYFSTVNFRMIAVPSIAMNVYNDFFSNHDLTYFCQITFLKPMMHCPYQDQLSVVMEKTYALGAFNASLFATEGIASVGVLFAPVAAFVCGLVIALGSRLSSGLPAGFILTSGAVLPQALLNVPLTTVLLTHGAGLLFLLWYVTPREIFRQGGTAQTSAVG
ncbi:MAG: hypothetical protein ACLQDM_17945 [Bradyrhizobium sp.]